MKKAFSVKYLIAPVLMLHGYAVATSAPVVTYPSDSKVLLQWANSSNATDYRIEFKRTPDANWNTFPDELGTTPGATVTGLSNGVSYDFRVISLVNGLPTDTSLLRSSTPTLVYNNQISNMILSTGQSLSLGEAGAPSLSTSQPFQNLMLNTDYTSLIPLVEPATGAESGVESMSSAMANMLSHLTRADAKVQSIVTCHGWSATPYSGIKKGTYAYNDGMRQLSAARTLTNAALRPFRVSAITTIHGESDQSSGVTDSAYEGYLKEWQHDYEADAKARTGQDGTVPLFLCQASSWVATRHTTPSTAIGQLNAAIDNPGKIYLVTPKYMFDYIDGIHLTNYSYRRLGEYYGKVMKKVLVDKEPWMPLYPTSIVLRGNVITVQFHVPSPPLQFDTNAVLFKTNYGFEYQDNTMSASISKVAITGPQTVTITLDKTPTGSAKKLAYAYTGALGWAGRNISTAPRGNLRDSDTTTAFYQDANVPAWMGNALKNWSVTFCEPITVSENSALISSGIPVFSSPANGGLSLADGRFETKDWTFGKDSWAALQVGSGAKKVLSLWSQSVNASWSDSITKDSRCAEGFPVVTNYEILTSNNSTNGSDGDWTSKASVTHNSASARANLIDFEGASWVKVHITNGSGSLGEIQVFDATDTLPNGLFFLGTSITAISQRQFPQDSSVADLILARKPGIHPAVINGGVVCLTSKEVAVHISKYIEMTSPLRYWAIELGLNDGWGNGSASVSDYAKNMQTIIDSARAHGIVPIIATPPATDPTRTEGGPWQLDRHYAQVVDSLNNANHLAPGPDFYGYFQSHPNEQGSGGTHPSQAGYLAMRRMWADAIVASGIYNNANPNSVRRPGHSADRLPFSVSQQKGSLTIRSSKTDEFEIATFSLSGQKMTQTKTVVAADQDRSIDLRLQQAPPGVYLVRVQSKSGNAVFKYTSHPL